MNRYKILKKIDNLNEASEKIAEAIDLISEAVQDTPMERSANAYIIAHLSNWMDGHNPYDETIPVLIESFVQLDGWT
jgi:hypothetical protein